MIREEQLKNHNNMCLCVVPDKLSLPAGEEPTYQHWKVDVQVSNQLGTLDYPKVCLEECKKNCSATVGENKCFGKTYISKYY